MAESSGFFQDINGDREYTADFLAQWIHSICSNGVFDGDLAVSAGSNMQISVAAGEAWINGYYYNNSASLPLTVSMADGSLARKDAIILRLDLSARSINAIILTGTPATSPTAPALTRTSTVYDLKLAEISVPAGTTAITSALITDTRYNTSVCGITTTTQLQDYSVSTSKLASGAVTVDKIASGVLTNISEGTYTGTDTHGSSSPSSLTILPTTKAVIITSSAEYILLLIRGCTKAAAACGSTAYDNFVTWGDTSVSWYSTSGNICQMNDVRTYYYTLLG